MQRQSSEITVKSENLNKPETIAKPETKKLSENEKTEADRIKARIGRKIRCIRKKLHDLTKKTASIHLLALEHPKFDKFHNGHNQEIRNLLGELKGLDDTKEHQELFRNVIVDLNLQSYCNRQDP